MAQPQPQPQPAAGAPPPADPRALFKADTTARIAATPTDPLHALTAANAASRDQRRLNRELDKAWAALPVRGRRRWERNFRIQRPMAGDRGLVSGFEVYFNGEEVFLARERGVKGKGGKYPSEAEMRSRYRSRYNNATLVDRGAFDIEAERINDGRNLAPLARHRRQIRDNGLASLRPPEFVQDRDAAMAFGSRQWRWHMQLGQGGYGRAMLYRCVDGNGKTEGVVVIKRDIDKGVAANDKERKHLQEANEHAAKHGIRSRNIVRYLGGQSAFSPNKVPRRGRTIMEYAAHGDLDGCFNDWYRDPTFYPEVRPIVPEEFCWHLLRGLAEAAFFLETGRTDPSQLHHPDWDPRFHYDLKPNNILLGKPNTEPGSQYWQQHYPIPIMADFGGVESYPPPNAWDNIPSSVLGMGTVGYRPFEGMLLNEQSETNVERERGPKRGPLKPGRSRRPFAEPIPEGQPVRIRSTIYTIGIVLWQTMTRQHPDPPQLFVPDPDFNIFPWTDYHARLQEPRNFAQSAWDPVHSLRPHYSARLVETVYWCMHPRIDGRPTPRQLLAECEAVCAEIDAAAPANGPRPREVMIMNDKYPIESFVRNDRYRAG